jgi:hypothetical protein
MGGVVVTCRCSLRSPDLDLHPHAQNPPRQTRDLGSSATTMGSVSPRLQTMPNSWRGSPRSSDACGDEGAAGKGYKKVSFVHDLIPHLIHLFHTSSLININPKPSKCASHPASCSFPSWPPQPLSLSSAPVERASAPVEAGALTPRPNKPSSTTSRASSSEVASTALPASTLLTVRHPLSPSNTYSLLGTEYADPWCGVCQGAYASINNNAADSAGYCMSTAEFDEAMGSFPEGENTCVADVQELMQVLLATEDSIFEGDQCPNKC